MKSIFNYFLGSLLAFLAASNSFPMEMPPANNQEEIVLDESGNNLLAAAQEIPSLAQKSVDVLIKNINYYLLTNPEILTKIPKDLHSLLKKKLIATDVFSGLLRVIPCKSGVCSLTVLDKEKGLVAAGLHNGSIVIVDLNKATIVKEFALLSDNPITAIKKLSDQEAIATDGCFLFIVNVQTSETKKIYIQNRHDTKLICAINENLVACTNYHSKIIDIYNVQTSELVNIIPSDPVLKLVCHIPNQLCVVTQETIDNQIEEKVTVIDFSDHPMNPVELTQEPDSQSSLNEAKIIDNLLKMDPTILMSGLDGYGKKLTYLSDATNNPIDISVNNGNLQIMLDDVLRTLEFNTTVIEKYDDHFILSGQSFGANTMGFINLHDVLETYSLEDLIAALHARIQKEIRSNKKLPISSAHAAEIADIVSLLPYVQSEKSQPNTKVRIIKKQLEQRLVNKSPQEQKTYLFSLLAHAQQAEYKELAQYISVILANLIDPLCPEEWEELPIDLQELACIALTTTDNKIIILPEAIAFQSPVLKAMFTGSFKEAHEKIAPVDFDAETVQVIKKLLYFMYENPEQIKVFKNMFQTALEKQKSTHLTDALKAFFDSVKTIPHDALMLAHAWDIPNQEMLGMYMFDQARKEPGMLKALFESLPTDCYSMFMPKLIETPHAEIITIQLQELTEYIAKQRKGDTLVGTILANLPNLEKYLEIYAKFISDNLIQIVKLHPHFSAFIDQESMKLIHKPLREHLEKIIVKNTTMQIDYDHAFTILSHGDELLIVDGYKNIIIFVNPKTKETRKLTLDCKQPTMTALVIKNQFVAIHDDDMVRVYNLASGKCIQEDYHANAQQLLPFDDDRFISLSTTEIKIWNNKTDSYRCIPLESSVKSSKAALLNETTLVATDNDKYVALWDLRTGKKIKRLPLQGAYGVAVLNDRFIIAANDYPYNNILAADIKIFDTKTDSECYSKSTRNSFSVDSDMLILEGFELGPTKSVCINAQAGSLHKTHFTMDDRAEIRFFIKKVGDRYYTGTLADAPLGQINISLFPHLLSVSELINDICAENEKK